MRYEYNMRLRNVICLEGCYMLPDYLTLKKVKGKFILITACEIPHQRFVGFAFISHPHIYVGKGKGYGREGSLITTDIGAFLTVSNNPTCELKWMMISGGYDWGLRFEDAWCSHLSIIKKMKKGEPLTIKKFPF